MGNLSSEDFHTSATLRCDHAKGGAKRVVKEHLQGLRRQVLRLVQAAAVAPVALNRCVATAVRINSVQRLSDQPGPLLAHLFSDVQFEPRHSKSMPSRHPLPWSDASKHTSDSPRNPGVVIHLWHIP